MKEHVSRMGREPHEILSRKGEKLDED